MLASCEEGAPLVGYELSGRITELRDDGEGGADPVAGATVTFSSDTLRVAETVSDGSGRYRLRVETDHRFGQVRASADGYAPAEATVYFDAPQRQVDLALRRVTD